MCPPGASSVSCAQQWLGLGVSTPSAAYPQAPRHLCSGPHSTESFFCTSVPNPPIFSAPHTWQQPHHAHAELPLLCPAPFMLLSMSTDTCSGAPPPHTPTHSQLCYYRTSTSLQTLLFLSHLPESEEAPRTVEEGLGQGARSESRLCHLQVCDLGDSAPSQLPGALPTGGHCSLEPMVMGARGGGIRVTQLLSGPQPPLPPWNPVPQKLTLRGPFSSLSVHFPICKGGSYEACLAYFFHQALLRLKGNVRHTVFCKL